MEIYYLKPKFEKGTDIICVVLDKPRKSFCVSFDFKAQRATKTGHTPEYLKKKYIWNKGNYQPMDAKKAKEQIVINDLEMHLPTVQLPLSFQTPTLF